ncbi:hypothetical protein [Alicyclobacillus sp. ALC3]|uniref:hypothetical protein n=1 Tax=Alicyclobacillus sp. ALC3 TaxID=2796143 RepID=UPI002378713A|nr:hypothetical protein [Alicyclobacillus sp. ALC3]WDL96908.1 hypothetical protein JC200_21955 [Alicyclobacillus sp. ALC3]
MTNVDEQLWVVWIERAQGLWWPEEARELRDAKAYAGLARAAGYRVRVHARHTVTLQDIIDG